jgi:hypothetical protein
MRGAIGWCAAAAALVGCGGLPAQVALPGSASSGTAPLSFSRFSAQATQSLLYVSNVTNDTVTVYDYPSGKRTQTLHSSKWPEGECTDTAGNIWIADDGSSRLVEYAHGGTKPIATVQDPGNYPYGCSVDAKTGNLAVTNVATTYGEPVGSLSIYQGAKGAPKTYFSGKFYRYYYCGYDPNGNLFVDGINRSSAFEFAELPSGKSRLTSISLNQSVGSPGDVEWDGNHVAIGDASASTIYQVSVSGSSGTVVGTTTLANGGNAGQFFIDGNQVIAGVTGTPNKFGLWKYPAGGSPTTVLKLSHVDGPYGVAVSK